MKLGKAKSVMILALVATLSACGPSYETYEIEATAKYGIAGLTGRDTYNASTTAASLYTTLNYTTTAEATNFEDYIINFVDGIITTDEFGVIQPGLAEYATHNEDYTEFTFHIREGVKWVTNKGKQYTYHGTEQYVSAQDWVTTAKAILDFSNGSDTYYLLTMFIDGAAEYYYYTMCQYYLANGYSTDPYEIADITTNAGIAEAINWYIVNYEGLSEELAIVTADDIPDIASGSRLGVTATTKTGESGGDVTFKLFKSADYFPSSLNYAVGIPLNENFYNDVGAGKFGSNAKNILYCGPYLFTKDKGTSGITFTANPEYWNKDVVHLETINYVCLPEDYDYNATRLWFTEDQVDSFTLNSNDTEGWKDYVLGEDGLGTVEDPHNEMTYSRFSTTIGTLIDCEVVPGRDLDVSVGKPGDFTTGTGIDANEDGSMAIADYCSATSFDDVMNTAKALSIQEVRQALLESFDVDTWLTQVSTDPIVRESRAKHTYTPVGLAVDDENRDYCGYYYTQAYATGENIEFEEAEELLEAGQYGYRDDGTILSVPTAGSIEPKVDAAKTAITAYNTAVGSGGSGLPVGEDETNGTLASGQTGEITLPIHVSYFDNWYDSKRDETGTQVINEMNQWLNGLSDAEMASVETDPTTKRVLSYKENGTGDPVDVTNENSKIWMWVYKTDQVESSTEARTGRYGCGDFFAYWGWGADYADPLTYLNTFTIGGDWSSVYPFVGEPVVDSFHLEDENTLVWSNLLEEYTELVEAGTALNDKAERFAKYAEAEYLLCNTLGLSKPIYNDSQGWILSVGRTATYEMPICSFGISEGRMVGLYVLEDTPTAATRQQWKANYDAAAAEVTSSMNIYK
ncbi:MAG: ABC transporter substrate-binding protein [Coprobacillus sp.]|nr:ABC transporter substrate-binding protein [Coprobacillus sp.]